MASTIGIKVADGEFYPVLEENSPVKKRLILTTAHDNQKSAQIDLYNSSAKTMADALYVGSLVVENITPQPKNTPSLEMILSANESGELSADIVDLGSPGGERQHLSVSLPSLEEDAPTADIPDFELESPTPKDLYPPRELYEEPPAPDVEVKQKDFPKPQSAVPLVACAAALLVVVCGLLYFFFLNDRGIAIRTGKGSAAAQAVSSQPPAAVPAPPPASVPAAVPAPTAPAPVPKPAPAVPVISAPEQPRAAAPRAADRTRTLPPVASYTVPQTIPQGGVSYTIRWGDTLWDISDAFYRNPWLYRRIARDNKIRNPAHIISGTTIRIYPR
ncbi:hypothetical protein AGMMS49944_18150 [Spirochaetia bacterium]|nr:hypothetical protein AGMMS49944_18150 [Spirochaetia bacterium]